MKQNKPLSDEQILKKAIEKAKANGWQMSLYDQYVEISLSNPKLDMILIHNPRPYHSLIFSHDFAKAFWGDKLLIIPGKGLTKICLPSGKITYYPGVYAWVFHLQMLVLEINPIKYLEKFI